MTQKLRMMKMKSENLNYHSNSLRLNNEEIKSIIFKISNKFQIELLNFLFFFNLFIFIFLKMKNNTLELIDNDFSLVAETIY